jgi:threonine synthase
MPVVNPRITQLRCVVCGRTYAPEPARMTCDHEGVEGILDVEYDLSDVPRGQAYLDALAARPANHWRYEELLPVVPDVPASFLRVGMTPLYPAPRLGAALGLERLLVKDDGLNPTASFKDRASSVGVVMARAVGAEVVACASTGNAASSLAGMAAHVGLPAVILVPGRAPAPKVAQLRTFGARVLRVDAEYSEVWELCQTLVEREGWYNRNCAVNPYLVEGKKTAGLELGEQLAGRELDWVAVSVGDGCTLAALGKGLRHMVDLGLLPRLPRLLGVQAEGAATVYHVWRGEPPPRRAETFADSICVTAPRNLKKAVNAIEETRGALLTVSDAAIREAMLLLPRTTGVFAEPAAAATLAGLAEAARSGLVARDATVVAVVTGNGLKDIDSAQRIAGEAPLVRADLDAIRAGLDDYGRNAAGGRP